MSGITLTQAETGLSNAISAMEKAVKAQGYSHSGAQVNFNVQRQSLRVLQENIDYWQNWVDKLSNDGGIFEGRLTPTHD